jgi:hypothetical protein
MLKKLTTAFLCGLLFAVGLATAQVVTRSVQMSQDPSGPIGATAANDIVLQYGTRLLNPSPLGTIPVVSACGTFTNVGTDFAGRVTITAGTPASCTLTFARAWGTAPNCIVAAQGAIPATTFSWATTTTTLVLTTAAVNTVWDYICTSAS